VGDTTDLARKIESYLRGRGDVTEGRVLSGDGFFLDGRLVAAVIDEDLCLPVARDHWENTMSGEGVRPLLVADRPIPGWVLVDSSVVAVEEKFAGWIEGAISRAMAQTGPASLSER
jgi:hypothetical protein